jgi:hypothetical protein
MKEKDRNTTLITLIVGALVTFLLETFFTAP